MRYSESGAGQVAAAQRATLWPAKLAAVSVRMGVPTKGALARGAESRGPPPTTSSNAVLKYFMSGQSPAPQE